MNRNFQITESLEQLVLDPNARDDEDAEKAADKAASALLQLFFPMRLVLRWL